MLELSNFKEFGASRKTFQGTGIVKLTNGSQTKADFAVMQRDDGQLFFKMLFTPPAWEILNESDFIEEITGTLSDDRLATLSAPIFIKNHSFPSPTEDGWSVTVAGFPSRFEIGDKEFKDSSIIIFDLVNCLFLGTEREKEYYDDGQRKSSDLSLLTLNLGERLVKLKQSYEYGQTKATLRAQKGIQVTCTAETKIGGSQEVRKIISLMDTVCSLMSVARGTLVNWISFDVFDVVNEIPIYSVYFNSVTQNFAELAPIREIPQQNTKLFLESGYMRYQQLDKDYQIKRISRAYVETRSGSFLETRTMLIGVLAEYLANVQAKLEERVSIMSEDDFEFILPIIENAIDRAIEERFSKAGKKKRSRYRNVMSAKLRDFNRRPLNWKLARLLKWLELDITDKEINDFIAIRDTLVHTGAFPKELPPSMYWIQSLHLLDRIMLRLFDYRGQYYDIENNKISEL